jgi:hypothetical protein
MLELLVIFLGITHGAIANEMDLDQSPGPSGSSSISADMVTFRLSGEMA